jgi:mannose-6-phosphate isomerase-like protein (cupin superfamily)
MQTRPLPETSDARSPAGAEIRYLMGGTTGDMIHSTVPPGQVNRATVHATVSEFWHVLSGRGEIWRRDESGEEVTVLTPGVSIDIPVATAFQYRCIGEEPLRFLCIAMPPWPGNAEATEIEGPWMPTAPATALWGDFGGDLQRCTMTHDDINRGWVICVIGVTPVAPAKFVVFRIQPDWPNRPGSLCPATGA